MSDAVPSPAASIDPDADDSRVYFGPFRSPEKKYLGSTLAVAKPTTPSPLRRSPRLSSPIPRQNADEEEAHNPDEDDDDEDRSRSPSGTPDNDGWQADEPSSVLASRITRAHDNPSPPPAAPVQEFDSAPPTPPLYPTYPIPFIISDSPSRGESPFALRTSPHPQSNLQQDLISFDSFSTSAALLPTHPIASTSFIPEQARNPSVDELLTSWSPSAREIPSASVSPPPSETESGNSKGKARAGDESTPEAAEERAVANALIIMDEMDVVSAPSSPPGAPTMVVSQPADDEAPQTPLRRSTRPRRSTTPHLVPLPSSDDESPNRSNLTPLTKKRRKTRDRSPLVPLDTTDGQDGAADVPGGPSMSEEDWETKKRRERDERKQARANATPQSLQRQLGSLSPGSANLLTQLMAPSKPSPVHEQEEPQPAFSFSVFSVNPAHTAPAPMSSPIRTSPARRAKPRSPTRIQFQPSSLDDPQRTPARRIPVTQAVAQGQISPQKGAQLLANNGDTGVAAVSRTPVFHIPPQDTPARRVNVNLAPPSAGQGKWQGMRFGSPTRGRSRERGGSVEPRPPWNASGPAAGPSDLRTSQSRSSPSRSSPSRSISAPLKQGKLPFPLTPSESHRPAPIPEADDKILSPTAGAPPPSPALGVIKVQRSNLKQPTSRIPRIGTKPYARPAAAGKSAIDKNIKAPTATARKVATAREPPSRVINVARAGSGSSSDDIKTAEAGPSSLKRKRIPSPQSPRPVVLIRRVPMKSAAPKSAPVAAPSPVKRPPSPPKRLPVAKFRMVDLHAQPKPPEAENLAEPEPEPEPEPASLDVLRSSPVSSPVIPPEELASDPVLHPPSSPPPDVPELAGVRRTTRLRKSVFPASVGPSQPLPTRRKVSNQQPPSGSGVFAGMTAVALKALTSSNTTKNQVYLAAKLETEVVRKEGARPESPAVKIRTIAQREQDEKGMRRKERAARRAQRGDDGFSENEGTSDDSLMDTDMDSSPVRRHRRGPGDEEEYETPKVSGGKRVRTDSMSEDGQVEKKRVKWDRGLSTAVFLDEVEPRPKARPKENLIIKKGCLAPTAKALRLDPLGNHPNAESPLKNLVEENIVVKKFVYDNDEPVVPVTVVKNTRSKAKKKS